MRDYGSFFKRERKFSGLSQKELAQGICSVKTISRIETGRQIPSPAQFSMLIERLGVSGFSYADFFDTTSINQLELKKLILIDLDRGDLEDVPRKLCEFRDNITDNKWEEQFFDFAMGWFCYKSNPDPELFLKVCEETLKKSGLLIKDKNFDYKSRYFTENECRICNMAAVLMYEMQDVEQSITLLNSLISNQSMGKTVLNSYWKVNAVLCNNAAVCEYKQYPDMARHHIKKAEKAVLLSGNALMEIRVRRNKIKILNVDSEDDNRVMDAYMLKEAFNVINAAFCSYEDFWSFLSESYLIQIL